MKNPKIKEDFNEIELEKLGYRYNIMEAGYISKDRATIVSIDRSPYQRQVMQYTQDAEVQHEANVAQLQEMNILE